MIFTGIERKWAHAILGAIYPTGADPRLPVGINDVGVDAFLTDLASVYPTLSLIGVRFALLLTNFAPLWVLRRFRTFGTLGADDQKRVLDRLYAGNNYLVRGMVLLLKTVGGMCYGGASEVRGALLLPLPAETPRRHPKLVQLRARNDADAAVSS